MVVNWYTNFKQTNGFLQFIKDNKEVAEIIETDIEQLLDPANKTMKEIKLANNLKIKAPCYLINGQIIWGATAMILSEFKEILSRSGS